MLEFSQMVLPAPSLYHLYLSGTKYKFQVPVFVLECQVLAPVLALDIRH